jgi:CRISPR type III-A-associated protein Csm2
MEDVQPEVETAEIPEPDKPVPEPAASETPRDEAPAAEPSPEAAKPEAPPEAPKETPKQEGRPQSQKLHDFQKNQRREDRPPRPENRGEKREGRGSDRPAGDRPSGDRPPGDRPHGDRPPGERGRDERGRDDRRPGGDRGERREGRPGGGRPFELAPEIELEKLISDSLYLDNQAHAVVARMRDMDSGTKSQLRRLYNAVRRAVRAPDSEKQHQFVMLRARLAYTIARHSLRSLDALERLLLQVTRRNDARGYERFKDLFEAIVAYNE